MVFRLLENAFLCQKIESRHFYSRPQAKFSPEFLLSPPRQREICHPPGSVFLKIFSQQKGEERRNYNHPAKFKKILGTDSRQKRLVFWIQTMVKNTLQKMFQIFTNVVFVYLQYSIILTNFRKFFGVNSKDKPYKLFGHVFRIKVPR